MLLVRHFGRLPMGSRETSEEKIGKTSLLVFLDFFLGLPRSNAPVAQNDGASVAVLLHRYRSLNGYV